MSPPLFITYAHLSQAFEDCHLYEVGAYRIGLPGGSFWHPRFDNTADATGILAEIGMINPITAARVEERLRALVREDPPSEPGTEGVGRTFRA